MNNNLLENLENVAKEARESIPQLRAELEKYKTKTAELEAFLVKVENFTSAQNSLTAELSRYSKIAKFQAENLISTFESSTDAIKSSEAKISDNFSKIKDEMVAETNKYLSQNFTDFSKSTSENISNSVHEYSHNSIAEIEKRFELLSKEFEKRFELSSKEFENFKLKTAEDLKKISEQNNQILNDLNDGVQIRLFKKK